MSEKFDFDYSISEYIKKQLTENIESIGTAKVKLYSDETITLKLKKSLEAQRLLMNFAIDYLDIGFGPNSKMKRDISSIDQNSLAQEITRAYSVNKFLSPEERREFRILDKKRKPLQEKKEEIKKEIKNLIKEKRANLVEKYKTTELSVEEKFSEIKRELNTFYEYLIGLDKYKTERLPKITTWKEKRVGLSAQSANAAVARVIRSYEAYLKKQAKIERKREYALKLEKDWILKELAMPAEEQEVLRKERLLIGKPKKRKPGDIYTIIQIGQSDKYEVLNSYKLKIPIFGEINLQRSIKRKLNKGTIAMVCLRLSEDNCVWAHITFNRVVKREIPESILGLDWGMKDGIPYTDSHGVQHKYPESYFKKMEKYDNKARKIQTKQAKRNNSRLKYSYNKAKAKEKNLRIEETRQLAVRISENIDILAVEKLNSFSMRRQGKSRRKEGNRAHQGFNRKLALMSPGMSAQILKGALAKRGKTLIEVESYGTSQVDFGTRTMVKRSLDEREWYSEELQKEVKRDPNAGQNVIQWGLDPSKHIARYVSENNRDLIRRIKTGDKTVTKEEKEKISTRILTLSNDEGEIALSKLSKVTV